MRRRAACHNGKTFWLNLKEAGSLCGFCRCAVLFLHDIEPDAGGRLIEYAQSAILFNPAPQATASGDAVACGAGLDDSINRPIAFRRRNTILFLDRPFDRYTGSRRDAGAVADKKRSDDGRNPLNGQLALRFVLQFRHNCLQFQDDDVGAGIIFGMCHPVKFSPDFRQSG